jgi:hypothetical protein
MDIEAILQAIDAEIDRLAEARTLLSGHTASQKRGMASGKRRKMSAEGRARIAAAQKARWAKTKRG